MGSLVANFFSRFKFQIFIFVFLAMLPAFLLNLYQLEYERNRELGEAKYTMMQLIDLIAQQESEMFDSTRQLLDAVSKLPEIQALDAGFCHNYFQLLLQSFKRYLDFRLIGANGNIICITSKGKVSENDMNIGLFNDILATRAPSLGSFRMDPDTQQPSVDFGYPVVSSGGLLKGILITTIDLHYLSNFEREVRTKLPSGVILTKVDEDGIILLHEPHADNYIGKSFSARALFSQIKEKKQGTLLYTDSDNTKWIYAFAPMRSGFYRSNVYVIAKIPDTAVFSEINKRFYRHILIISAFLVVLSVLLLFTLDPLLLHQMKELTNAALKMKSGELGVRARILKGASIEVRQLTHAFNTMAISLEKSRLELIDSYETTLEGWVYALDMRDNETTGHSKRVTDLSVQFARAAGVPENQLPDIRRGALLHDIGKIGVPDSILKKQGPLTDEEWVVMKKHPEVAQKMLSKIKFLKPAVDIPYCHHEKWDGSGYPRGLKGEKIPLSARLFAIVDVWDALNSDRPYRKAWPREKALEYIKQEAGKHFDPRLVELFMKMIQETKL